MHGMRLMARQHQAGAAAAGEQVSRQQQQEVVAAAAGEQLRQAGQQQQTDRQTAAPTLTTEKKGVAVCGALEHCTRAAGSGEAGALGRVACMGRRRRSWMTVKAKAGQTCGKPSAEGQEGREGRRE